MTVCGILDHQHLHTEQHCSTRAQGGTERKKRSLPHKYIQSSTIYLLFYSSLFILTLSTHMQQVYSQSPHFLPLISAMTSDTDENFTRSLKRMCVSHLAQACSFIDVATKNKNDTCCALCPGYQEQTFSSNSSRLPVHTN